MDDDTPAFTRQNSSGLVAPIIAGALLQNMLFGVLIVVFSNFFGSSGWARQSSLMRSVIGVVLALTAVSTGLYMHDVFFYSLTFTTDFDVLDSSTVAEGVEPVLVGLIGGIVQQTLALRASRLISTPALRWAYLVVIGSGSLLALLGSIGVSWSSITYTVTPGYVENLDCPLSIAQFIEGWAWASAATDMLISVSYIVIIRRKVRSTNQVTKGAIRMVSRYVLESALFTTIFAVASAITVEATDQDDPAQYDMSYITWMPCSSLYALSLFTTLSIAERVHEQMSDFPHPHAHPPPRQASPSLGPDLTLAGSFFTTRRGSLLPPATNLSPPRKAALEAEVSRPGEPAWAQRSTSFLGVKIPLESLTDEELLEMGPQHSQRPPFRRATTSAD